LSGFPHGEIDKGWLIFRGEPLVRHIVTRLAVIAKSMGGLT
jgi:molybdopterin-guanine dinucleotide biosynthesis protein A